MRGHRASQRRRLPGHRHAARRADPLQRSATSRSSSSATSTPTSTSPRWTRPASPAMVMRATPATLPTAGPDDVAPRRQPLPVVVSSPVNLPSSPAPPFTSSRTAQRRLRRHRRVRNPGDGVASLPAPRRHPKQPSSASPVRAFLEGGGNFLAQCHAVLTFEGTTGGRRRSPRWLLPDRTASSTTQISRRPLTYPNPTMAFSQFQAS